MARDSTAFELREALVLPGCAICSLTLRSVGRYLEALAYERVNDLGVRANLRAARGFCNLHAHRWLRDGRGVLGTALIYRDVIRSVLPELETPTAGGSRLIKLKRLRGRPRSARMAECPACAAQREAEDRFLSALAALMRDAEDTRLFEASDGLCFKHAIDMGRRGDTSGDTVLRHTRQRAERLLEILDEVIRKEDYRFRQEPRTPTERTAPADVVAWTIGREGLVDC
jgi:hypothetical protein